MLTFRPTLVWFALPAAALLPVAATSLHRAAIAQDASRLPESARLALRARSGDQIKMEGDRKVTTHIHLEAVSSEFSSEAIAKGSTNYQFRGRGSIGTMMFAVTDTITTNMTNSSNQPVKPTVFRAASLYTVRPNLEVIRSTPIGVANKKTGTSANTGSSASGMFGVIRFPDKVLKSGDTWSGNISVTNNSDLRGISMHFEATVAGFEMYQGFPCARVETNYSYKGPLPGVEAQVRKQIPAGSKLASEGQLTGTETTFYALDRGWPLNESAKITVALALTVTVNGQMLEVGGTIDTDSHSAVVGYPTYDPSLVPKVAASTAP